MSRPSADQFFHNLDELTRTRTPRIDRPRGTAHPRIPGATYPVDYGEVEGVAGGDGAWLDVFVGSAPGRGIVAVALTCDPLKRDVEIKVLLDCTPDEVAAVEAFLSETLGIGGLVVPRSSGPATMSG